MAILTVDSLTGCNSIPDFIAGASKSIFNQTAAPTSWTKDTTHNNKALRIIGGANGTALTTTSANQAFTTVLGPKSYPLVNALGSTANITFSSSPAGIPVSVNQNTQTFSSDSATLSTAQLPAHTHPYLSAPTQQNLQSDQSAPQIASAANSLLATTTTQNTAISGHSHNLTSTTHGHPISDPGHTHTISNTGPHTHSVTVTQDFSVLYVDVIICSKD